MATELVLRTAGVLGFEVLFCFHGNLDSCRALLAGICGAAVSLGIF